MDFNKPIRDYFEETVKSEKFNKIDNSFDNERKNNLNENTQKDVKVTIPEVKIQEHNKPEPGKGKYANFIMPPPYNTEKQMISRQRVKSKLDQQEENKKKYSKGFMNQSLQTEGNSFEFDEWEFDYDA